MSFMFLWENSQQVPLKKSFFPVITQEFIHHISLTPQKHNWQRVPPQLCFPNTCRKQTMTNKLHCYLYSSYMEFITNFSHFVLDFFGCDMTVQTNCKAKPLKSANETQVNSTKIETESVLCPSIPSASLSSRRVPSPYTMLIPNHYEVC